MSPEPKAPSSECSSPVPRSHVPVSEPSSRLFPSDLPDREAVSSECGCDTCTQGGSQAVKTQSQTHHRASEVDPDLQALESELDEPKEYCDLILSPNSHDGYSSCGDDR